MLPRFCLQVKFLFAVLICGSICFSQTRPSPSRPAPTRPAAPFLQYVKVYEETPYVTKVVLKNGMTVLVNEYRLNPVVAIQAYVHAGYFDDPAQNPGMASLVAAVVQRGAGDKSGGSYRQQVQSLGGVFRTATSYSTTLFEVVVPSNQWKRALTVQAETILNPSFETEKARLEAKLLQNEAGGILDNPGEFGTARMLELAFNQPGMGKFHTIRRRALEDITPEGMAAFYKTQYTPAGMMLVVSGDVSSSEILNEVVRLYSKPSGPAAKTSFPFAGPQSDFRFDSMRGNVATPHLFFGFRAVPESEDDFSALEVLSAVIGAGEGSVLSARVRDQKKLILDQETKLISYPEYGYLSIHATVNSADIDRSEIAILTEIELLKREEPTEAEIERALALLERSYWEGLTTVTGRANRLAHFEYLGDWRRLDRKVSDLRKVKPQDVKRVAAKYLRLQSAALLEYLPEKGDERLLTGEVARQTFSTLIAPAADQEQAERDKETVPAVTIPPRSGSFKFSEIRYPFQTASILRGPDLFIREDHSNPIIEMGLFFPGGRLDEKKDNGGITNLMTILMLKGGSDPRQWHRQLEVCGGRVQPVVTEDYFGLYLSVLSQNFEAAFKLVLESIRAPAFDKEAVERQKGILLQEIVSLRNSRAYPQELLNQALFEGFSYSIPREGTETSIASVTAESLKVWYDAHVRNRKPVAVLIGDTKGTSLASVFVRNFSGSRIQEAKLPGDYAPSLEKGTLIDRKWSMTESLISLGFQAPPADDEDANTAAVLEGYAGDPGRLSQELRDKLGMAHRVSVVSIPRLRGGSFIVRAATSPENEADTLKALREEIQRMRTGPIPFRDFRAAINEAAGAYAVRQQARSAQIAEVALSVMAGKGIEGFQNHAAGLQEVRDADLQAVVQRIFNLEKAATVIMRGTE